MRKDACTFLGGIPLVEPILHQIKTGSPNTGQFSMTRHFKQFTVQTIRHGNFTVHPDTHRPFICLLAAQTPLHDRFSDR